MKAVLTSVLLCAFLQVVWFSFSTGQTDAPEVKCPDFDGNSTKCCVAGNKSCVFFRCNESGDSDGKCVAVASASPPPTCSTTPPKPGTAFCNDPNADTCKAIKDNSTCCADDKCGFFVCNSTDVNGVCAKKNATDPCSAGEQSTNTCENKPTTTTVPPTTTTPPKGDACTTHNNKTVCCDAHSTDGCLFYMCPDKNNTVCRSNTTAEEEICSGHVKPNPISCTETTTVAPTSIPPPKPTSTGPSTSQSPTQAPSGGGSGGGRHFDGASFIGGIVLCAGLVAIGYFGLKFYKSRQERNYHTL